MRQATAGASVVSGGGPEKCETENQPHEDEAFELEQEGDADFKSARPDILKDAGSRWFLYKAFRVWALATAIVEVPQTGTVEKIVQIPAKESKKRRQRWQPLEVHIQTGCVGGGSFFLN